MIALLKLDRDLKMNENTKMENLNKRYSTYKLVTANGFIHPITPPLKKKQNKYKFLYST